MLSVLLTVFVASCIIGFLAGIMDSIVASIGSRNWIARAWKGFNAWLNTPLKVKDWVWYVAIGSLMATVASA